MSARPSPREIPALAYLGEAPSRPAAPCARCGAAIPPTSRGIPRRDARYCSPACRSATTRELRAAAREDTWEPKVVEWESLNGSWPQALSHQPPPPIQLARAEATICKSSSLPVDCAKASARPRQA